jgi:hypothetical protein
MTTDSLIDRRTADRLAIAETMYRYAAAVDHIGSPPVKSGEPNAALAHATDILRSCMTDGATV